MTMMAGILAMLTALGAVVAPVQAPAARPAAKPGQAGAHTTPATDLPTAGASDDVIVRALRLPRDKLPARVYWDYGSIYSSRLLREQSEQYMRCALKRTQRADLRQILDGEPNSGRVRFAQGSIMLRGAACQPGLAVMSKTLSQPEATVDFGTDLLHRAVIVELIMHGFADDAELTRAETQDPAVRERFQIREGARNRLRLPGDQSAFGAATCLVGAQPELAGRLFRSKPNTELERGLVQAILVDGHAACLGATKRLTIDTTFFRGYIVDAYYRWLIAAQNVATLLPGSSKG